ERKLNRHLPLGPGGTRLWLEAKFTLRQCLHEKTSATAGPVIVHLWNERDGRREREKRRDRVEHCPAHVGRKAPDEIGGKGDAVAAGPLDPLRQVCRVERRRRRDRDNLYLRKLRNSLSQGFRYQCA